MFTVLCKILIVLIFVFPACKRDDVQGAKYQHGGSRVDSLGALDTDSERSATMRPGYYESIWDECGGDIDKEFHDFLIGVEHVLLDSVQSSKWVPRELYDCWGDVHGVVHSMMDSCRALEAIYRSSLREGVAIVLYDRDGVIQDSFIVGCSVDTLAAYSTNDVDGVKVVYRADAPPYGFDRSRPIPDSLWYAVYRVTRSLDLRYDVDTVR